MKTVDFIRATLNRSARAVLPLIEDMRDLPFTFPTPKGGNHPLWVLGHLAWTEGQIIQLVMLGRPNPVALWQGLFGIGSEATAEAAHYPTFEDVLKAFQELQEMPEVTVVEGIVGAGRAFFAAAVAAGHEGVVAKRLDAPYCPGRRAHAWQKIKPRPGAPEARDPRC